MHEEGIVINRDYNGNLTPSALFFNIWIQNRSLFYNSVAWAKSVVHGCLGAAWHCVVWKITHENVGFSFCVYYWLRECLKSQQTSGALIKT